jgi:hypothetical protein
MPDLKSRPDLLVADGRHAALQVRQLIQRGGNDEEADGYLASLEELTMKHQQDEARITNNISTP